ncbi:MAG TPA: SRPBCC family protein [Dehalococcoidia bacterium]|nr:SRPBCC family protein [Dehalococcoidia bacterium]
MPTASAFRIIAAPRERVWAALADITGAGRWNSHWRRIEITSPQQEGPGTTFRAHTDQGDTFDFQVTRWQAPDCIAFAPVRDDDERYELTLDSHTFFLYPAGEEHTRVELVAAATARGIRGRLVGLFLWPAHQKPGLAAALDALQALFEPEPDAERDAQAAID